MRVSSQNDLPDYVFGCECMAHRGNWDTETKRHSPKKPIPKEPKKPIPKEPKIPKKQIFRDF